MADATLAELTTRIAEKLFILIAGETVEAEDSTTIQKVIVSVHEQLREDGICYWSDSATPQHVLEYDAAYIACFLANDYMDAAEARTFKEDRETGVQASLAMLRSLTATRKRVAEPVRSQFF